MEGLQAMKAMLSKFKERSSVLMPVRARASAASQPACPAPTTTAPYSSVTNLLVMLIVFKKEGIAPVRAMPRCRRSYCFKMMLRISSTSLPMRSLSLMRLAILSRECITVVWSLPPSASPMEVRGMLRISHIR